MRGMSRRAEVSKSVVVNKPAEVVFDYLVDIAKHPEWSPKPLRIEEMSGPVAPGMTWASYGFIPGPKKEHRNDVEVTVVERPTKFAFVATEQGEKFVNTFTLTPEGNGTKVTRHLDIPVPPGVLGVLFPLISAMVVNPGVAKNMAMFKQRADAL